jgi:hypothetical protein
MCCYLRVGESVLTDRAQKTIHARGLEQDASGTRADTVGGTCASSFLFPLPSSSLLFPPLPSSSLLPFFAN